MSLPPAPKDSSELAENRSGRMDVPQQDGRKEDDRDGSTGTSRAVSSTRLLSVASGTSGDPVTREWEEVPCQELIGEIFRDRHRPPSSSEDGRAASTSSPRSVLKQLLRWRRHPQQQNTQQSPLASSLALEPPANDGHSHPDPSQPSTDELRGHAIDTLVLLVHKDLESLGRATEDEVNALLTLQADLRRRAEAIGFALRALEEEKEGVQLNLQRVLENVHALEKWGRENGNRKAPDGGEVDVDNVFVSRSNLSAELLRWQTADRAIDDVDSKLEKMLQDGSLPFRLYLESLHALATRQFLIRASWIIIQAAQVMLMREETDEEMGEPAL